MVRYHSGGDMVTNFFNIVSTHARTGFSVDSIIQKLIVLTLIKLDTFKLKYLTLFD